MQRYVVQMQIKVIYDGAIALGGQLTMARRRAPPFLTMQREGGRTEREKEKKRRGGRKREERRLDRIKETRKSPRDLKRVPIRCLRSECCNQMDAFDMSITKSTVGANNKRCCTNARFASGKNIEIINIETLREKIALIIMSLTRNSL